MEGLGSSGRLVGSISTYRGTYKCPWSEAMAKKLGGIFFTVQGLFIVFEHLGDCGIHAEQLKGSVTSQVKAN